MCHYTRFGPTIVKRDVLNYGGKKGKELKLIFHRENGLQLKTIIKHFDDYWMDNLL